MQVFNNVKVLGKIILLGCCLLVFAGCQAIPHTPKFIPAKPPHTLRVASYNIDWDEEACEKILYPKATLYTIQMLNANILLVKEATLKWERILQKQFKHKYPYQQTHNFPNSGGLAILSKYPIY